MISKQEELFSIIIPTCNEGHLLDLTIESILTQTNYPSYEIIIVNDGSTDGSCEKYEQSNLPIKVVNGKDLGVSKARNTGAENANGEYFVFLDSHCKVSPDWLTYFRQMLSNEQVGVAGPAFTRLSEPFPVGCGNAWIDNRLDTVWFTPCPDKSCYEVPLTIGACQAFSKKNFYKLGRYEEAFIKWGYEDVEICLRAWLLGYTVVVNKEIVIAHYFREERNYEVKDNIITANFLKLLHLHFSPKRISDIIASMSPIPDYELCMEDVSNSNVFETRNEMEQVRLYDDNWFFNTLSLCPKVTEKYSTIAV
jgi:glycosyltransferase involved in cell wall biosynthesis